MERDHHRHCRGKLFVVGIGPGSALDRTKRAEQAIENASVIAGYNLYLELIEDLIEGKKRIQSGMRKERERCRQAIESAAAGETVALVSSGDAGIYGMAGLAIEMAAEIAPDLSIEIVPGVTASSAAAAVAGAPLMLDYASISLSDLLVPWEIILQRLEAVVKADLVVALYNPKSKKRRSQIVQAAKIFSTYRPGATPVCIATAVGSAREKVVFSDLDGFLKKEITMRSIVIIGNSTTKIIEGQMVTPRGYRV